MSTTLAHDQAITHRYHIHYPAHEPRADDPHYHLFEAYRRAHKDGAQCAVGKRGALFATDCRGGLELHHKILEFAVLNDVNLPTFIHDFPDVTNADELARWAESAPNFEFLCAGHHRGHAGVHVASASDWSGLQYVPGLVS